MMNDESDVKLDVERTPSGHHRPVRYACMPRPVLTEEGLSVRAVQPGHIEDIRQWRNRQMDVLRQAAVITPEQQTAYYATQVWPNMDTVQPDNILLSYEEHGSLIGYGGLVHIAWIHRRAEVSFLLSPECNTGEEHYARYFSIFLRMIKVLAFEDLGLERLCTETYAQRTHHILVLEAAGFHLEGILRNHVWIGDRPVDAHMHGCVKCN